MRDSADLQRGRGGILGACAYRSNFFRTFNGSLARFFTRRLASLLSDSAAIWNRRQISICVCHRLADGLGLSFDISTVLQVCSDSAFIIRKLFRMDSIASRLISLALRSCLEMRKMRHALRNSSEQIRLINVPGRLSSAGLLPSRQSRRVPPPDGPSPCDGAPQRPRTPQRADAARAASI